ncbi:hypothetical protein C7967_11530 [Thalassospira sp. 11-3]|nr:hypothetical protein C7967_11530 [Thalassospira sp. 11-3]
MKKVIVLGSVSIGKAAAEKLHAQGIEIVEVCKGLSQAAKAVKDFNVACSEMVEMAKNIPDPFVPEPLLIQGRKFVDPEPPRHFNHKSKYHK